MVALIMKFRCHFAFGFCVNLLCLRPTRFFPARYDFARSTIGDTCANCVVGRGAAFCLAFTLAGEFLRYRLKDAMGGISS